MWPHTLQMTRDECRGILRRLELESYSHVISVFRAQGGLNEKKAKLLEELRSVFHISLERHRAEARRVSNDEELSTISELISGPNTWQEWSREGRRAFPMLPRVAAQTALSITAHKVSAMTALENAKLPYPAATAEPAINDDNTELEYKMNLTQKNLVTCDPFKMPEIPDAHKKVLKRSMGSTEHHGGGQSSQGKQKFMTSNNNNANSNGTLDMGVGGAMAKVPKKEDLLTKQRYFYSQQAKAKKQNAINARRTNSAVKNPNSKRSQKALLKQEKYAEKELAKRQQLQLLQQQQQQQQQEIHMQNSYAHNNNVINMNESMQQQQHTTLQIQMPGGQSIVSPATTVHVLPQLGTPKKDKNMGKLSISAKPIGTSTLPLIITTTTATAAPVATTTATTTVVNNVMVPLSPKFEQKGMISTPVKRYIVADRPTAATAGAAAGTTVASSSGSSAQIMTLPHITAAANKLRAINTTILPPGTKLQPATIVKKPLASNPTLATLTTLGVITDQQQQQQKQPQQQIFNVISHADGVTTNLSLPTHAPPSIINLHGVDATANTVGGVGLPSQGKVLTTKILPIVLSNSNVNAAPANIINANSNSISNTMSLSSGAIIKTVTPGGMLTTNTSQVGNSSGNTYISTLSSGAQVFRKPSILRKTTITPVSSSLANIKPLSINTGVQNSSTGVIMGNYKVSSSQTAGGTSTATPIRRFVMSSNAVASTSNSLTSIISTSSNSSSSNSAGTISSSGGTIIRPTYKYVPSNGKVYIQASGTKFQAPMAGNQQRVPLQNVKIIPPSGGAGVCTTLSLHQAQSLQPSRTTTLMLNNKNGSMVFLPTGNKIRTLSTATSTTTSTAATTTTAATIETALSTLTTTVGRSTGVQLLQKPNVVVINSSGSSAVNSSSILTQTQYKLLTTNATTSLDTGNNNTNNNNNSNNNYNNSANNNNNNSQANKIVRVSNQAINDDELDILNMPIVVEDNDNNILESTTTDGITTFTSLLTPPTTDQQKTQQQQQQQQQPVHQTGNVVLGIDWEMELDQVAAAAATRSPRFTRRAFSVCSSAQSSQHSLQKGQPFVLPKQLGRTLQAKIDASGILGFPRGNFKNRHITDNKPISLLGNNNINNNNNNNNDNKNLVKNVIVIKPKDSAQDNSKQKIVVINNNNIESRVDKLLNQSNNNDTNIVLNINDDDDACIPMDLENDVIETTAANTSSSCTESVKTTTAEDMTTLESNADEIMDEITHTIAGLESAKETKISDVGEESSLIPGLNKKENVEEPAVSSQQLVLKVDVNTNADNLNEMSGETKPSEENTIEVEGDEQNSCDNGVEVQIEAHNSEDNLFEGKDYYELDADKTKNILLAAGSASSEETASVDENFLSENVELTEV